MSKFVIHQESFVVNVPTIAALSLALEGTVRDIVCSIILLGKLSASLAPPSLPCLVMAIIAVV